MALYLFYATVGKSWRKNQQKGNDEARHRTAQRDFVGDDEMFEVNERRHDEAGEKK